MDTRILIPALVIVAILIVIAAVFVMRRRRSNQLKSRFGPEYDRAVRQQDGDARRAEAALADRERRVEAFPLRPLSPVDREAYAMEWAAVQRRFVDDPSAAVGTADRLVNRVMTDRGYPMTNFEQRAADISVSYPAVVQNYRAGHEIVVRHSDGQATTEELRQAMVHYRSLFDELLQPAKVEPIDNKRKGVAHERAS
jgi:Tfp pilus assembly protein PilX